MLSGIEIQTNLRSGNSLLIQGFPDWEFFSRLFPNKQEILFEYQALSLLKENTNTKKWVPEED